MRRKCAGVWLLGLVVLTTGVRADDVQWRPAGSPAPAATSPVPPATAPQRAASLGLPTTGTTTNSDPSVAQAAYNDPPAPSAVRAQGDPFSSPTLQAPPGYAGPPPLPPPSSTPAPLGGYPMQNEETYNRGMVTEPAGGPRPAAASSPAWIPRTCSAASAASTAASCRAIIASMVSSRRSRTRSCSRTRVPLPKSGRSSSSRAPPNSNWVFNGGSAQFFGLQARVAVTERISFVINKFGGVWTEPSNAPAGFGNGSSFAEFWLGPK